MPRTLRSDNDTWLARLGEDSPGPGLRAVLFFCKTTDQRPYRVATVEEGRVAGDPELEALSQHELEALFARSQSMGQTTSRALDG